MENLFNLSKEQNIFLAKKVMVEEIFNLAIIENCNLIFSQTQTIIDGISPNVSVNDIITVKNLQTAWRYIINNFDKNLTLDFICKLNSIVSSNKSLDPGVLRYGSVGISGTDYIPPIPQRNDIENKLNNILSNKNKTVTEKSFDLCLFLIKSQLFWDGNKRTAIIATNKYLVENGCGLLSISANYKKEFKQKLTRYYSTDDNTQIKQFFHKKCVKGLFFERNPKKK